MLSVCIVSIFIQLQEALFRRFQDQQDMTFCSIFEAILSLNYAAWFFVELAVADTKYNI